MKILTDSNGKPYINESGKALKNADPILIAKTITANGNYSATDDNADGYSSVNVATENKLQKLLADEPVTLTADDFAGVTKIAQYQFWQHPNILGCYLPDTIESIESYAFNGCSKAIINHLPSGLTKIASHVFVDTKINVPMLPSGVTSIGASAFQRCTSLAITAIPSGVTYIGAQGFAGCTSLAITAIPSGVTSIENQGFYSCYKLTSLTFEGTPNTISSSAFSKCNSLTQVRVPWSEGEVAGAPWGATNATITYNYTGE